MKKKQIVLLIVEGPSDDEALSYSLMKLYEQYFQDIRVEILHGDITSQRESTPSNIVTKVGAIVKSFLNQYSLKKNDISKIIQITDTDGAFIPDDRVLFDKSCKTPRYTTETIRTLNPANIIARNKKKAGILRTLRRTSNINTIPYHVVFMSCNLDHVLYDKLNCSDEEKEKNAFHFQEKYEQDLNGFWSYIARSSFSVQSDFVESWKFIEKDLNSLNRYTNIHTVLPEPIPTKIK